MIKKLYVLVSIFALINSIKLYSQVKLNSAEEVLKKYITAVGGESQIKKIKTLEIIEEQFDSMDTTLLTSSIYRNEVTIIKSKSKKIELKAKVKGAEGVNITPDGIFCMPQYQVKRFEYEQKVIPEIDFLSPNYKITLKGLSKISDTTSIYEIEIIDKDGYIEKRGYNQKTGLLQFILNSKKQLTLLTIL